MTRNWIKESAPFFGVVVGVVTLTVVIVLVLRENPSETPSSINGQKSNMNTKNRAPSTSPKSIITDLVDSESENEKKPRKNEFSAEDLAREATDADKAKLLSDFPPEVDLNDVDEARKRPLKTVKDICILYRLLNSKKTLNKWEQKLQPETQVFLDFRRFIINTILPQCVKDLRKKRDEAFDAFVNNHQDAEALRMAQAAQEAFYNSLKDTPSNILKREVQVDFPKLCESHGESFGKDSHLDLAPTQMSVLRKICPKSYPSDGPHKSLDEKINNLNWTIGVLDEHAFGARTVSDDILIEILSKEPQYEGDTPIYKVKELLRKPKKDLNELKVLYSMLPIFRRMYVLKVHRMVPAPKIRLINHILPQSYLDTQKAAYDALKAFIANPDELSHLETLKKKHQELKTICKAFCPTVQKATHCRASLCNKFKDYLRTGEDQSAEAATRLSKVRNLLCRQRN